MFKLTGNTAVVTGGARGIGKGIATALSRQGANVVIADLLLEEARKTAAEIEQPGSQVMAIRTDITSQESVKSMVKEGTERFGAIDILVNNAGWDRIVPFIQTEPEFWDKIITINYRGLLNLVHAVIPGMIERNRGKIISISSDAARVGSMGESVYAGVKAAVIGFSKSMARELARNKINVNVVCPGPTDTPLVAEMKQDSDFSNKILSSMDRIVPLKRLGTPDDIAAAVVFLASKEADYITGQTLSVNGGLNMI